MTAAVRKKKKKKQFEHGKKRSQVSLSPEVSPHTGPVNPVPVQSQVVVEEEEELELTTVKQAPPLWQLLGLQRIGFDNPRINTASRTPKPVTSSHPGDRISRDVFLKMVKTSAGERSGR